MMGRPRRIRLKKDGIPNLSPGKQHPVFHLKGVSRVQKKDAQFPRVSTWKLRIKRRRNLKYIVLGYQRNASSQRYEKNVFFGMLSARGLTHSIMQHAYSPMVLNKQYSMPIEALMS